ncbi:MAG: MBL fold metallo-hydrolase [Oscillospiraceae bacterium]|nr:MBL fold metallo-hydrolase [Oscillospiraceae bacterium]
MKKTYVTSMPDHIGAFLKASECFSSLGVNITRVSYNKAVDSQTLFIDAEGTREQLQKADAVLREIGYLGNENADKTSIVLLEFCLKDVPGSVTDILRLISEFHINISYLSSQENGTDYQYFKMGLHVEDTDKLSLFLSKAEELCKVRVIDYNRSQNVYDNSIFYNTYVHSLSQMMGLSPEAKQELLININLAMQTLDETGLSPYRTFDSISRIAELICLSKGEHFDPRISTHKISDNTDLTLIEPPCGSNTIILRSMGEYLFIDSGYACYKKEMLKIFHRLIPNFDTVKKKLILTHADVDHCGLLSLFDEIYATKRTAESLENEYKGCNCFREENPIHKPYIRICKILTEYSPVAPEKLRTPWSSPDSHEQALTQIGFFSFGDLNFEVYEGRGGHLPGELILIDYDKRIAFTGDVYINTHGLTAEQAKYNQHAPILMTSVDTDPKLCAVERNAVLRRLGVGNWQVFGAHGFKKDYSVSL